MSIQGARGYIGLAKDAAIAWWADRAMSMGASIAFYAASSLAPLLLLVISISGLALGEEAARGAIVQEVGGLIGRDGAGVMRVDPGRESCSMRAARCVVGPMAS